MKPVFLFCSLFLLVQAGYTQTSTSFAAGGTAIKNAIVKREEGIYNDAHHKAGVRYAVVYVIDTSRHQVLNVSLNTKSGNEARSSVFYYSQNNLEQAVSRVVQSGVVLYQMSYTYDAEDWAMKDKDLAAFSESDEKYALLKESKKYIAALNKL